MSEFDAGEETTAKVRFDEPKRSRRSLSQLIGSVVDWWGSRTPEAVKDVWNLARWETQNVRCWRTIIFILLLITGALVSTFTFVFLRKEQDLDFEENYDLFVHTVQYSVNKESHDVALATRTIARTISGAATSTDSTGFPFVRAPLFEIIGYTARQEAPSVDLFTFTPIVVISQRPEWESFSMRHADWIEESRAFLAGKGAATSLSEEGEGNSITPYIWETDAQGNSIPAPPSPFKLPIWQTTPPPRAPEHLINLDLLVAPYVSSIFRAILLTREGVLSPLENFAPQLQAVSEAKPLPAFSQSGHNITSHEVPRSVFVEPVFRDVIDDTSVVAGLVHAAFSWVSFFESVLPDDAKGLYVVLKNTCDQVITFEIVGSDATYVGEGDLHETKWDHLERNFVLTGIVSNETLYEEGHCVYSFSIYPSDRLKKVYDTLTPIIFAITAAASFVLIAVTFIMYDRFVIRRNENLVNQAARTNRIIASLFPSNVRDRLLADEVEKQAESGAQTRLKDFLANDGPSVGDMTLQEDETYKTRPIADLFPEATVLFQDIAGFTAWSSTREPDQVFTLLETIYRAFDQIAKTRRVYKVETIGDCYVACTGLPEPHADHAIAMCRFAIDCLDRMTVLTKKLEVVLGPDTSSLAIRTGIHSGPVTAGVLRGDRSRFQLFGDTVNTAALMESSGKRDCIQLSQETADILIAAGKIDWLVARADTPDSEEREEAKTYWLRTSSSADSPSQLSDTSTTKGQDQSAHERGILTLEAEKEKQLVAADERTVRLVKWVGDLLLRLLKRVVAKRRAQKGALWRGRSADESVVDDKNGTVLEEVKEFITLPSYDKSHKAEIDIESITLGEAITAQVYAYVSAVSSMYHTNHFHNFEHASHVTMSVAKLMSRIVAPTDMDFESQNTKQELLHDHTYGITSDPLTQFACVFSALIHDVDHTGVPNEILMKEDPTKARYYKGRSVAEQNSVDLAWEMLMQEEFKDFRSELYTSKDELLRFRQLVVNSVMATDIMDKDLKTLRNGRWERAFSGKSSLADPAVNTHRKATIVIEHLIQASDVSHTMQHWHVYRKWNERLFREMHEAFKQGRSQTDPTEFWYKGEIGFFDFYIIPLAKKLKDCGVFGVSSDEYLQYAQKNRDEWASRGRQIVAEYIESAKKL